MSDPNEAFSYPPLPTEGDAIRILTLQPGSFRDPLNCTLSSVAIGEKPKYVALSYTWDSAYHDNARLPLSPTAARTSFRTTPGRPNRSSKAVLRQPEVSAAVEDAAPTIPQSEPYSNFGARIAVRVNEAHLYLRHNLVLALLYLRSPAHPLPLWVDAVCINQADIRERNAQVAMMSYIYFRAQKVVAWLGTKDYRQQSDQHGSMVTDWSFGASFTLGLCLACNINMTYSSEPDMATLARITESLYWSRLWIVQEACLSSCLVFVYGPMIWSYEGLKASESLQAMMTQASSRNVGRSGRSEGLNAMVQVLNTREAKHTDAAALESLIEVFGQHDCTELRDKVFALLGLANDVRPVSAGIKGESPVKEKRQSQESPTTLNSELQMDLGAISRRFSIDYSRSITDLWADVVKFIFAGAKRKSRWGVNDVHHHLEEDGIKRLNQSERQITIVRVAGIVQKALDRHEGIERENSVQEMPKESHALVLSMMPLKSCQTNIAKAANMSLKITAMGYISGEILHVGPEYTSMVSSSHAHQDWLDSIADCYRDPIELETLRRINEHYTTKIFNYDNKNMSRIREIRNQSVLAWSADAKQPGVSHVQHMAEECDSVWAQMKLDEKKAFGGQVMALGTGYLIGVVPPAAKIGDVIVRFWNCNAAVVMRPVRVKGWEHEQPLLMIVGRADVAEVVDRNATPGVDLPAEQALSGRASTTALAKSRSSGAVYVSMDLQALQILSASVVT